MEAEADEDVAVMSKTSRGKDKLFYCGYAYTLDRVMAGLCSFCVSPSRTAPSANTFVASPKTSVSLKRSVRARFDLILCIPLVFLHRFHWFVCLHDVT